MALWHSVGKTRVCWCIVSIMANLIPVRRHEANGCSINSAAFLFGLLGDWQGFLFFTCSNGQILRTVCEMVVANQASQIFWFLMHRRLDFFWPHKPLQCLIFPYAVSFFFDIASRLSWCSPQNCPRLLCSGCVIFDGSIQLESVPCVEAAQNSTVGLYFG